MYYYFIFKDNIPYKIAESEIKISSKLNPTFREMTEEQKEFYFTHPTATPIEVWRRELNPEPVPPTPPTPPTMDDIRHDAIQELDRYSRESLGKVVDVLGFCDALAGTIYAGSRGLDSVYSNDEIFSTADDFLSKRKLLREKFQESANAIAQANTQEEIYNIVGLAKIYFDNVIEDEDTLEKHKRDKIREIEVYDISENVNGFFLNDTLLWLDRDTRTSLVNTLNSAVMVGRENINIWFSGMYITLHVNEAKQLLAALEIYATDCYNVTAQHKVDVQNLETIEEVDAYDVSLGYPQRLEFNMNK